MARNQKVLCETNVIGAALDAYKGYKHALESGVSVDHKTDSWRACLRQLAERYRDEAAVIGGKLGVIVAT